MDKGAKTDHRSDAEQGLDRIERSLTTVVVGLEILTGICAGLEDTELEEEVEEIDGEEDMEQDEELPDEALIAMGRDSAVQEDAQPVVVTTAVTLQHLISNLSLPTRLSSLASLNTLSFPPIAAASPHPPTTSILSVLHLRALETLNNLLLTIVASLPTDGTRNTQIVPVNQIWDAMFGIIDALLSEPEALTLKGQELRLEVLEMALGCAWGCAKIAPELLKLSDRQVKTLMDVPQVLRSEIAKTRCIDTLSSLASRRNVTVEENKVRQDMLAELINR